jgi:hypothetical protein
MSQMFQSCVQTCPFSYCNVLNIDTLIFCDRAYFVILLVWRLVWIFKVRILVMRSNGDLLRTM